MKSILNKYKHIPEHENEYIDLIVSNIEGETYFPFEDNYNDLESSLIKTYKKSSIACWALMLISTFIAIVAILLLMHNIDLSRLHLLPSTLLCFLVFFYLVYGETKVDDIRVSLSKKIDTFSRLFIKEDSIENLNFVNKQIKLDKKVEKYFLNISDIKKVHVDSLKKYLRIKKATIEKERFLKITGKKENTL